MSHSRSHRLPRECERGSFVPPPYDLMPHPSGAALCHRTRDRWVVTVADRQGVTVTVDVGAAALQTCECLQVALLRKTASPFRYLPVQPLAGLACSRSGRGRCDTRKIRAGVVMQSWGGADAGDVDPDHALGIGTPPRSPPDMALFGPCRQ
jgi:hypothetical protein